jgi:hypothetical protein|tara:strand:- start:386 stop:733 length:348 start_codon:yes stop_codon:yes gene_type:complete
MSDKDQVPAVKVSVATLRILHKPAQTYFDRLETLIEDHYKQTYIFNNDVLISLMELRISAKIITTYLDDLLLQAQEAEVEELFLDPSEVKTMAFLSKGLARAVELPLGNTNLRSH